MLIRSHRPFANVLSILLLSITLPQVGYSQFIEKLRKDFQRETEKVVGDVVRETKKAVGDTTRETKKVVGDVTRETKNAVQQGGALIGKPFRHLGDNAKESIFFGMRNHVVGKNNGLGIQGRRFVPGHLYSDSIRPFLPANVDFSNITWYFGAYVPSDMAGITFGNDVYIRWPYRDFDESYLALMAHETGHVIQYQRWGTKGFARRYMNDTFGSWTKYPNFNQVKIHDDMNIEREASAFASTVMNAYWSKKNSTQSNSPNFVQSGNSRPQPAIVSGSNNSLQQLNGNNSNNGQQQALANARLFGEIIGHVVKAVDQHQQNGQQIRMRVPVQDQHAAQPRLGINVQSVNGRGALVTSVNPGSPAQRAGIELNDIVVAIDNQRVYSAADVLAVLRGVASTGQRQATVLLENHRLGHLPLSQRYTTVQVAW